MARRNDRLRAELAAIDQEVDRAPAATRKLQRYLPVAAAVVAIGSFGAITWYAYNQGVLEGSEVAAPLIKPKGPLKIPPESPGGVEVPNRDKFVYSQLENREIDDRKVERLLPPPEQPKEPPRPEPPVVAAPKRPTPQGVPPALPPPGGAEEVTQAPIADPAPSAAGPKAKPESQTAQAKEPEGPIRLTPRGATPPPSPPAATEPARKPAVSAPAVPRAPPSPEPEAAKPAPKAVAPKAVAPPATGTKGAFIQLGAMRSEADAQRAWQNAQGRAGNLLDGLRLDIERADIPGKGTYFRVQAGPLRDAAAAKALCDALQQRQQGCFVVHRR